MACCAQSILYSGVLMTKEATSPTSPPNPSLASGVCQNSVATATPRTTAATQNISVTAAPLSASTAAPVTTTASTVLSTRPPRGKQGENGGNKSDLATLDIALTPAQVDDVLDKVNLPSLPPSLTGPVSKASPEGTQLPASAATSSSRPVGTSQVPKLPSTISIPNSSIPKASIPTHTLMNSKPPAANTTSNAISNNASSSATTTNSTPIKPADRKLSPSTTNLSSTPISRPTKPSISTTPSSTTSKQESSSSGRWTREEHEAFLAGLKVFGREWKKVAQRIPTRTSAQIRSHAQKYFAKLARDEQQQETAWKAMNGGGIGGGVASMDLAQRIVPSGTELSASVLNRVEKILKDPASAQREVEETLRRLRGRYTELQRQRMEQQQRQRQQGSQASLPISTDISGSGGSFQDSSSLGSISAPITCALDQSQNVYEGGNQRSLIKPQGKESQTSRKRALSENPIFGGPEPQRPQKNARQQGDEALASKELIALHVLGGALYRSGSQENLHVMAGNNPKGSLGPPESPKQEKLNSTPTFEKKKSPTH